jgi:hypothetical protein
MGDSTRSERFHEGVHWPRCENCGKPADHHYLGESPGLFHCERPRHGRVVPRSPNLDTEIWTQLRLLAGRSLTPKQADAVHAARIASGIESDQIEMFGGVA